MQKRYLYLIIIVFSFVGCKKYLDIKPKGQLIPSTFDDYANILNSDNIIKTFSSEIGFLDDDFYNPEVPKDKDETSLDNRVYYWSDYIYQPSDYGEPWNVMYNSIYQCNVIINGINDAADGTAAKKAEVIAQARISRAELYFNLVTFYSKAYNSATAGSDLGVPIVTDINIAGALPGRGSVQEVYDFIIKEINESVNDLPNEVLNAYLINKASGYGLLARVYFSMKDYENAKLAADQTLGINDFLLNYNDVYGPGNGYSLYTITSASIDAHFSNSQRGNASINKENLRIIQYTYTYGMLGSYLPKETISLFDSSDLRRMFWYVGHPYDENYQVIWTDTITYYYFFSPANVSTTTPEVYLIRAESNARMGNLGAALSDLNKLRQNRILAEKYAALNSSDQKQVIKWIIDERRRELLGKVRRWLDIKRLADDPDFSITPKHYFSDGSFISLPPGDPRYELTLPESALTENITQNPR